LVEPVVSLVQAPVAANGADPDARHRGPTASPPPRPPIGRTVPRASAVNVTANDPIVDRVARSRLTVLITGESGAGKEVLARRLHERSPRATGPLVSVNAGAVCESLLESELFGYERGSFTGAVTAKPGVIEAADGGTLFLDEIAEMSLSAQVKLLRVLETRLVTRVGGLRPRAVDVRFVAATNRDLGAAIAEGTFREDLWFRLDGIELHVAPLRTRTAEILPAAREFLAEQAHRDHLPVASLSAAAERALIDHDWPGNFRELRNVIERAALICDGGRIEVADLLLGDGGDREAGPPDEPGVLNRHEIVAALTTCAGNQTRAARMLGISRRTLITRLEALGIARPRTRLRALAGPHD
jgi:two-component system response regulator AtoC